MADLNDAELNALAKAAGIEIPPELLTEVGYSLNALLDALDQIRSRRICGSTTTTIRCAC